MFLTDSFDKTEADLRIYVHNVPVVWAWEFAARTVLLDWGGLWAFGDVLAVTKRNIKLIKMLNSTDAGRTQSFWRVNTLTSINGPTSFRQGVWKWVGMWDCVTVRGRGTGWGWGGRSWRGCRSSWRGGSVWACRAGARTRAWASLGVVGSVGHTPAWKGAVSLGGRDTRLGPGSWGQWRPGWRRWWWGGAITTA